jgi:hypothetical protein
MFDAGLTVTRQSGEVNQVTAGRICRVEKVMRPYLEAIS